MNESLQTFASPVILLIGAALFAILFTVILTTLRRVEVFPTGVSFTLAICASLLAVLGTMRTFGDVGRPAKNAVGGSWMDTLLLPYTAMGIAMLLVLLLCRVVSGAEKVPRCPKRQIRAESRESIGAEHEHRHGDGNARLAKE